MLPRRDLVPVVVVVVVSSEGEMGCARMSQASSAEGASTRYCRVARVEVYYKEWAVACRKPPKRREPTGASGGFLEAKWAVVGSDRD